MTTQAIVLDDHQIFIDVLYRALGECGVECVGCFDKTTHAMDFLRYQPETTHIEEVYLSLDLMNQEACHVFSGFINDLDIRVVCFAVNCETEETKEKHLVFGEVPLIAKSNNLYDDIQELCTKPTPLHHRRHRSRLFEFMKRRGVAL